MVFRDRRLAQDVTRFRDYTVMEHFEAILENIDIELDGARQALTEAEDRLSDAKAAREAVMADRRMVANRVAVVTLRGRPLANALQRHIGNGDRALHEADSAVSRATAEVANVKWSLLDLELAKSQLDILLARPEPDAVEAAA